MVPHMHLTTRPSQQASLSQHMSDEELVKNSYVYVYTYINTKKAICENDAVQKNVQHDPISKPERGPGDLSTATVLVKASW